ncbi:hypothetical protein [Bradyrhizobium sp. AC87j1]|uniref:hypothetical protein n=1 Tax=Bradyrhizobium sp. AC87j1 TaxID=2055894 RepID=UPI00191C0DBC|nr:hypothetical protein [Bradyrhizobium sp. AC87j1]
MPGGDEILIPFQQRDAIFELLHSLFEALPELVVHLSSFRKLQRPKINGTFLQVSGRRRQFTAASNAMDRRVGAV